MGCQSVLAELAMVMDGLEQFKYISPPCILTFFSLQIQCGSATRMAGNDRRDSP
jgi:hypothetical protein